MLTIYSFLKRIITNAQFCCFLLIFAGDITTCNTEFTDLCHGVIVSTILKARATDVTSLYHIPDTNFLS